MTPRPQDLAHIAELLLTERREAALRSPRSSHVTEAALGATIAQLRFILRFSVDLPSSRIEIEELPFDRFLLTHSESYFSTRKAARDLGVRIRPNVISKTRALIDFEPRSDTIQFSPILPELQWICSGSSPEELRLKAFKTLQEITISVFHELNHAVFFRCVRSVAVHPGRSKVQDFFNLHEALAIVRDLELARELGSVGQALYRTGIVYRASAGPPTPRCRLNPASFRYLLLSVFLNLSGYKPAAIRRALGTGAESDIEHRLLKTGRDFIDGTLSYWLNEYRTRHPRRIELPKRPEPPKALRVPLLRLRAVSPKALLNSSSEVDRLYRVYAHLFYRLPPRLKPLDSRKTMPLFQPFPHPETTF